LSQKTLQPFLFKGYQDILKDEPLYITSFPKQWWNVIEKDISDYRFPFKPKTIAKRLSSLFPEIVFIQESKFGEDQPWIIATDPIPTKAIVSVCMPFLMEKNGISNKNDLSYEISLEWRIVSFEELDVNEYQIIPALFAKKFVQVYSDSLLKNQLTGSELQFFTVYSGSGYEVVSVPYSIDDNRDKFSYVIKIELITRGLENTKLLKITPGSRRYYQREAKNPVYDVRYGETGSIYVSHNHIYGVKKNKAYSKFFFERKKGKLQLKDVERSVLHDLFPAIPEVEEIFKESKKYIKDGTFLIGYSNRLFEKGTSSKQGISVQERNSLIQLILDLFPSINVISKHRHVNVNRKSPKLDYLFLNTLGKKEIRIGMFVPEQTMDVTLKVWESNNYIFNEGGDFYLNSNPRIKLTMIQYGSEIIKEISVNDGETIETAKKRYKNEFSSYIFDKRSIDGAFIEIEAYHLEEGSKEKDPKEIIRESFRQKKIVTQFIHPENEKGSYSSRLNSAFLDLLTDIGFSDPHLQNSLITKRAIVSFSMIRRSYKEFLPVLTKIEHGQILFKTPLSNEWLRTNEYLTSTYGSDCFFNKTQGKQLKKWLESELIGLLNDVEKSRDIILMVDANVRNGWLPEFKNENIKLNEQPFGQFAIHELNRLKVVRFNLTNDVPNYYISKNLDDDGNNHATGLFRDEQGIYYAVGEKTPAMRTINKNATRLESKQTLFAKQQAVEIIPLTFSDEDEQNEIAFIVHNMRSLSLTYISFLRYPINAHLAVGLRKYFPRESDYYGELDDFDDTITIEENGQLGFGF
jgi:hypothetical protein